MVSCYTCNVDTVDREANYVTGDGEAVVLCAECWTDCDGRCDLCDRKATHGFGAAEWSELVPTTGTGPFAAWPFGDYDYLCIACCTTYISDRRVFLEMVADRSQLTGTVRETALGLWPNWYGTWTELVAAARVLSHEEVPV